ncbi:hypothetical protein BDM02DRAFT_940048 [Thelephora ganbajun]|uniref:Uncharacterized protein n=1 Tax=Thelephora ganbajun TaxID=370292 RepID=A0ACB6Z4J3_THEGA|nr:hypothetical protein BDM02DRAFT_940048 [Thelephora ganbajun]
MDSSKFVTSEDGTKIWADAVGDPSKPSVMFIPVTSSSTLIFGKRFEDFKLTKHLRLVHYGIRKQGLSNQPLDPSAWTSNKFEDFKAVVEAYRLKKPFIAPWSAGGAFRGWNTGIINPWLAGVFPRFLSPELSNLCSTARDFTEVFTFYPDKIRPAIKFAWIGA